MTLWAVLLHLTRLRQDELPPQQEPTDIRKQVDGRNESVQTRSLQHGYSTDSKSRQRQHDNEYLREDGKRECSE